MENVEIKKEEKVVVKKAVKKPAKKSMNTKQVFMTQCNERRAAAKLPAAYTEEEIKKAE